MFISVHFVRWCYFLWLLARPVLQLLVFAGSLERTDEWKWSEQTHLRTEAAMETTELRRRCQIEYNGVPSALAADLSACIGQWNITSCQSNWSKTKTTTTTTTIMSPLTCLSSATRSHTISNIFDWLPVLLAFRTSSIPSCHHRPSTGEPNFVITSSETKHYGPRLYGR